MKRKTSIRKEYWYCFWNICTNACRDMSTSITKEKRANDNVLVIVSGSNTQKDRGTRTGLSLNRRFRNVREVFYDDELIVVDKLDEADMPPYPEGWVPWVNCVKDLITKNTDGPEKITFYVESQEYVIELNRYYPSSSGRTH